MSDPAQSQIERLVHELNEHSYRYYVLGAPTISDREFDRLLDELEELESGHPDLVLPDSPNRRIGSDLSRTFPTVRHVVSMLSLDNTYSEEELVEFDARLRRELPGEDLVYLARTQSRRRRVESYVRKRTARTWRHQGRRVAGRGNHTQRSGRSVPSRFASGNPSNGVKSAVKSTSHARTSKRSTTSGTA